MDRAEVAAERKAWRTFGAAMVALAVAFLMAVYSDVLAREGNVLGTAVVGSLALGLAGFVGVTWVPRLARRTSIEWLRATVDYQLTREGGVYIGIIFILSIAALNTGNNMLFLILAAMLAAILVSGLVSLMVLSGVDVEVLLPDHVFARQPVLCRVKLANTKPLLPTFLSYVLSFVFLGIYWSNHHHMLHTADRINGKILWANLHLLFWLSLTPFVTAWMGQNRAAPLPTAIYGTVLLLSAVAYTILQSAIISMQGPDSKLKAAVKRDWKGKISLLSYVAAIPLAFVHPWLAEAFYVLVAVIWLVPDRRIEKTLTG